MVCGCDDGDVQVVREVLAQVHRDAQRVGYLKKENVEVSDSHVMVT